FRKTLGAPSFQYVEALGIGLHQPVLDAVVDHLHEMPGARRAGVNVAALGPVIASDATQRARYGAVSRCERVENGVEHVDDWLVAADHQAIAALETPDSARCTDVDI